MNPAANPDFVAAEVAYRYETGHISRSAIRPARHRGLLAWVRGRSHHDRTGPRDA